MLLEVTWPAITDITSIMTYISNTLGIIWGYFTTLLGAVTSNTILMFVVLFPIVCSIIYGVLRILRKFGVR